MASSSTASEAHGRGAAGSLVRQLSFGVAIWVGILGLTVASLSIWQYWRTSVAAIDSSLTDAAQALTDRIVVVNGLLEIELDAAGGLGVPVEGDEAYYAVYDAEGQLLYGTSSVVPDQLRPSPPFRSRDGYREALVGGPSESVVVAGQSLRAVYGDVRRLATSLSIASFVGAALALPVAVWLRRQLARSIGQIDETARSLAPGHPTRIDLGRVADEFVGVARALNGAFDRLDEAIARERQLTSDASHELRTPAATLLAEARWALQRPRDADAYRRSLEVCARQGARMKDLVESLLTLARLEAGTLPPARDHVELRPVVEEAMAELQALATESRVALRVNGDVSVWADHVQLRILVSNLLSNAIRYNRPEGEVLVGIGTEGPRVILTVSDTGRGLDPALAARAFERFWRADSARSTRDGGSGLGLAISKAIVDAHAGRIMVVRTDSSGTTFRVELPAWQPESSRPPMNVP
jgi:signal transduction histidine kinase